MTIFFTFNVFVNILFIVSFCAQLVALWNFKKQFDKKDAILNVLRPLLIVSVILCVLYYTAIKAPNQKSAHILYCLGLIFYNTVIFEFLLFINTYIKSKKVVGYREIFLGAIMCIDSLAMIMNIGNEYMFTTESIVIGTNIFYKTIPGPLFYFHYAYSLILVLWGIIRLSIASYNSSRNYKKRYLNIVFSVIGVLLINLLFIALGAPIDLSGIVLPFASIVVYYYAVIFAPAQFFKDSRAAVIDEIVDAILIFDVDGIFRDGNKAAIEMFGLNGNADDSMIIKEWVENTDIDLLKKYSKEYVEKHLPQAPHLKVYIIPYYDKKYTTEYTGTYIRIHDMTADIQRAHQEVYKATHDGLTGLLNRDAFLDSAQRFIEDRESLDHYLVCANIENFKLYNNLFGPEEGDKLLYNLGVSFKKKISHYDLLGRMEADRFCVLLPKKYFDESEFLAVYSTALQNVNRMHHSINAYLGVYEIKSAKEPMSIIYSRTLLAAQSIKGSVDEFVAYYDQSITESIIEEQHKIDEIRHALSNGEFEFFIQPQVAANGKVLGGEALVRWNHPQKGIISPYFFIGLMEKHGMIASLDLMIWEKVCQKLADWKKDKITESYLSVNISTKDFYYLDVYETFIELTNKYGIEREKLKLEITESAVMNNEKEQIALIENLRAAGFTVEMDDFGSGYSSLNMLNKMPVDVLKLDMGFLQKTADKERSKIILKNIEALAGELSMITIAEGVETKDQATFLTSIGCDILQGYLFSPPVPVEEFETKFMDKTLSF